MWHKVKQEPLTSLNGVGALRRLTGQHDTVGTIEDSIGDIANFGTRRARIVLKASTLSLSSLSSHRSSTYGHRLKHLSGNNDGLASHVAFRDHHFLGKEDLAGGDFNTEIATGNHDTISRC